VLRATVPPKTASAIAIKTLPAAVCSVQPSEGGTHVAHFFANHEGDARFFVTPAAPSDAINRLSVHCESGTSLTNHVVELRAAESSTADFPPPPKLSPPTGKTRPGLSRETALGLSDADLLKRGYPLPPDEKLAPDAFKLWLDAVTKPFTLLDSATVANPYTTPAFGNIGTAQNGPQTSETWSGVQLPSSAVPFGFGLVQAVWTVPKVMDVGSGTAFMSVWVGISDDNTDLAQAGTAVEAAESGGMLMTTYYAWTELLPNQTKNQVLTEIPVGPGEQFSAQVAIGFAADPDVLPGYFMISCLGIFPAGAGVCYNYTPLGSTANTFSGSQVEWILERSSNCDSSGNCTPYDLPKFGNVTVFTSTLARLANAARHSGWVNCCGAGSSLINMKAMEQQPATISIRLM
jgi:hypothetical protein